MAKLIITLLIIITIITVLVLIGSKAKKWPAITITSLLVVELILCIYRNKSEFFITNAGSVPTMIVGISIVALGSQDPYKIIEAAVMLC